MKDQARHVDALLALLLAVCLWGIAPVATRYLVGYLAPLSLLALRFGLSGLLLAPLLIVSRPAQPFSRNDLLLLGGCGLVGIIGYNVPVTFGIRWVPANVAGIIIATEPIWIVIIAMIWLHEIVTQWLWIGLIMSAAGVITLVLLSANTSVQLAGAQFAAGGALVLLGAVMWAAYTVMVRVLSRRYGALQCTAATTIAGTLPLLVLSWWQEPLPASALKLGAAGWEVLAVLALGSTVLATTCWNYGLSRVKSSQAGLFLYLIPLISLVGGYFFLGEVIRLGTIVSCVLIVGGVGVAHLPATSAQASS